MPSRGRARASAGSEGMTAQAYLLCRPATRRACGWLVSRLELIPPQPAVHGDHGAGDVAGERRDEVADEAGHVLGLAVAADRDLVVGLPLPVFGRVVAADLLGMDAARRGAVHRDTVLADLVRQALGPGVGGGLSAEGAVETLGLRVDGVVDGPTPIQRLHLIE